MLNRSVLNDRRASVICGANAHEALMRDGCRVVGSASTDRSALRLGSTCLTDITTPGITLRE
ncbi:MAG: hypothetical protein P8H92_14930, partial [Paracoccaceae bacterium]|nr:hypothetical protein [Paracoccaceae bacterium]